MCSSTRVGDNCNVKGGTLIGRHVPTLQHDVAVSSPTCPRGEEEQGRLAAASDSEVDPAPANSQSRLLIAQLMAPLGLHAGDEYDAKEFGRGSSQRRPSLGTTAKALPNLFSSSSQTFPWVGLASVHALRARRCS